MNSQIKSFLKIIGAIFTIAFGAQLTIDVGSIPITGQTLAVLSWAFFLSPREAFISLFSYLILGFIGVPLFADGASGIEKLSGGSGGFLVGFLISATTISYLNNRIESFDLKNILLLTILGTLIILLFGVGRLMTMYGFEKGLEYGLYPFWKGAVFKVFLGSMLVWGIKKGLKYKV